MLFKVKDVIALLQTLDQDAIFVLADIYDDPEGGRQQWLVSHLDKLQLHNFTVNRVSEGHWPHAYITGNKVIKDFDINAGDDCQGVQPGDRVIIWNLGDD